MNELLEKISMSLQLGKAKDVKELVQQALDEGLSPKQILHDALLKGMGIVGVRFKNNEVFVPEVLIAARAMNFGLSILRPHLADTGVEPVGKAVICTVKGDLHDIGKNLVKMMLEGQGFEVIDLGVDIDERLVCDAIRSHQPDVVCLSALLTTTMMAQKSIIEAIASEGLRNQVRILVGGAPVTKEFAEEIGADGYSADAASAAELALALIGR